MSAIDDFDTLLGNTEVVKRTLKILKGESARLLRDICREYQRTGQPVPDHRLQTVSYLASEALNTLLSAGLIERQHRGSLFPYCYEPTPEGWEQHERLKADNFY